MPVTSWDHVQFRLGWIGTLECERLWISTVTVGSKTTVRHSGHVVFFFCPPFGTRSAELVITGRRKQCPLRYRHTAYGTFAAHLFNA